MEEDQVLSVWDWTNADSEGPLHSCVLPTNGPHTCVKFNRSIPNEIVSNGHKNVLFWYVRMIDEEIEK